MASILEVNNFSKLANSLIVIIVGADNLTALTTARAIRQLPIKIIGIAKKKDAVSCYSNCWDHLVFIDSSTQYVQYLIDIGDVFKSRPLILLSQDADVIEFSNLRNNLLKSYQLILPLESTVRTMMDKTLFHQWATNEKLSVPKGIIIDHIEDLVKSSLKFRFPVILKPLVRAAAWDTVFSLDKLFFLADENALTELVSKKDIFQYSNRYILQEWIPGEDSDVYFSLFSVSLNGTLLGMVHGRKHWQWPPQTGSTAFCSTVRSEILDSISQDFLHISKMIGLCSVEYKKDPRNGQYYITEPTIGRNDYQSGLTIKSDINLTELLVADYFGFSIDNRKNYKNAFWIDEISCVRRYRYIKKNKIIENPELPTVAKFTRIYFLLFRFFDFFPFVLGFLRLIRKKY